MRIQIRNIFYLYCFLLLSYPLTLAVADEVVILETRPGVTQSFLLLEPDGEAEGVILIFPGHWGVV